MIAEQTVKEGFIEEGYAVLPSAIPAEILRSLLPMASNDAKDVPIDPRGGLPWAYDVFSKDYEPLTRHAHETMEDLGAVASWLHRVTLVKKMPGEPRRYWHNDADGEITGKMPTDILALYYLTGSNKDNGALLVRPGYKRGPKHEALDDWPRQDEVAVPVEAGDVILMDPRLQHASLPNNTDTERLLIRIWMVNRW